MAQPKLKAATIYLPAGKVKRFAAADVVAWGMTPSGAFVATKDGAAITKYIGFPAIFVEEESAVEIPTSRLALG